jgi:hypothetical protein
LSIEDVNPGVGGVEHEQEFKRGCIVLNRLFKLAQRECPFRVIERVADGFGRVSSGRWLGLLLTSDSVS